MIEDKWFSITDVKKEFQGDGLPIILDNIRDGIYEMKWDNSDPANAPSCLVSYSKADTDAIKRADLAGKLIIVWNYVKDIAVSLV